MVLLVLYIQLILNNIFLIACTIRKMSQKCHFKRSVFLFIIKINYESFLRREGIPMDENE